MRAYQNSIRVSVDLYNALELDGTQVVMILQLDTADSVQQPTTERKLLITQEPTPQ